MVTNQAVLFLIFVINGIAIGLLFDVFRILRRTFHTSDMVTYVEDILFWLLTGCILLYSIFTFNQGEIRLFLFIGILLGCILYLLTFSRWMIKISVTLLTFLKNTIGKVLAIIFYPIQLVVKWMKKIMKKPISFIIINLRQFSTNIGKMGKKLIQKPKIQPKKG
jgi:spore cortex biosynthesis protein YabQ